MNFETGEITRGQFARDEIEKGEAVAISDEFERKMATVSAVTRAKIARILSNLERTQPAMSAAARETMAVKIATQKGGR